MSKKATSFVKEVLARIKGDAVTVTAEKNYRKASAGISGQIASLNSRLVEAEGNLEEANENLENAKYPTDLIGNVNDYVANIKAKQDLANKAKDALEDIQHTLTYYKDLLAGFDQEVETAEKA